MQVEPSPILKTVQQDNQSYHKNIMYVRNLISNVSTEDTYILFGLTLTAYLHKNCHVDIPLNQQTQKSKSHVYITAAKHVCDEWVKLNGLEFKGNFYLLRLPR